MPRPRSAPSRAAEQMQGFQLTWAPPGHSRWPNGQNWGLCSKIDTGTKMIMPQGALTSPGRDRVADRAGYYGVTGGVRP